MMRDCEGRYGYWDSRSLIAALCLVIVCAFSLPSATSQAWHLDNDPSTPPDTSQTVKEAPLVIIFDVSGSMNDNDDKGVNKLGAAKKTMTALLRNQSFSSKLGLWTFPGGNDAVDGCYVGGWIPGLSPSNNPDATAVNSRIRSLTADGGTPTGPAIRQAVDSLKKEGFQAGTLLLVSDGEANCGAPPCDVVKEIRSEGFDLKVPAVGFDISSEGSKQLQCVAQETGAGYHEATNSEDLIKEMSKYQTKDLDVKVDFPQKILKGANAVFKVTVTNPSPTRITGLHAGIIMDSGKTTGGSDNLFLPVLAPQKFLPSLEAEQTIEFSWTATAATGKAGTAKWRILVGSSNLGSVVKDGSIVVTDDNLTLKDAGPVLKDLQGPIVVMGDSYSSGEGAGIYLPKSGSCHRSRLSYGGFLAGKNAKIFACSGAETKHITKQSQNVFTQTKQIDMLDNIPKETPPGVILMTIGGNDIGFATIVRTCFVQNCIIIPETYVQSAITQLSYRLEKTYRAVLDASKKRWGKHVPLIISPYPNILWEQQRDCNLTLGLFGFSVNDLRYGHNLLNRLNGSIKSAVEKLRKKNYPIYYAEDVLDFPQPNHTICDKDSYFVKLDTQNIVDKEILWPMADSIIKGTHFKDQELAHPNRHGYRAWANSIILWSQSKDAVPIKGEPITPSISTQLRDFILSILNMNPLTRVYDLKGEAKVYNASDKPNSFPDNLHSGDTFNVNVKGFAPNSSVIGSLTSNTIPLGTIPVNDSGVAQSQITIPEDLPFGKHRIELFGLDSKLQSLYYVVEFNVGPSFSLGFIILLGVGLLFLVPGLVMVIRSLHRIRRLARQEENAQA